MLFIKYYFLLYKLLFFIKYLKVFSFTFNNILIILFILNKEIFLNIKIFFLIFNKF